LPSRPAPCLIDITAEDDHLILTAARQPSAVLLPQPGGRHLLPGLDCEIEFQRTDGRYIMKIRQERNTQTATRTPP
jgi:hypothetical protein